MPNLNHKGLTNTQNIKLITSSENQNIPIGFFEILIRTSESGEHKKCFYTHVHIQTMKNKEEKS